MEYIKMEIRSQSDIDFTSVIILSLKQLKEHFKPEEEQLVYNKESKEIDFMGIVTNASTFWANQKIEELQALVMGNSKFFYLRKEEIKLIKYFTDLYWDYAKESLEVYAYLNIDEKFYNLENQNNSKNILKIVK